MEALLSTRGLTFSYDGKTAALDGVTVEIYPGERVAVLGANGSGKSTFFLCLDGVLEPSAGEVCYRGNPVGYRRKELLELRRRVGIVFQDPDCQMIAPTVAGEISFGPMNLKLPRGEVARRVEQTLSRLGLEAFRDRPPHALSGGEKKRVSIAGVMAMEPEMMIFDEPTAFLDRKNAVLLEEELEKLSREGMTILLSTHDMDLAWRWAQRVLVFENGRLAADGKPEEIFGDQALLRRAGLEAPVLLEIWKQLKARGIPAGEAAPRTMEELGKGLGTGERALGQKKAQ